MQLDIGAKASNEYTNSCELLDCMMSIYNLENFTFATIQMVNFMAHCVLSQICNVLLPV